MAIGGPPSIANDSMVPRVKKRMGLKAAGVAPFTNLGRKGGGGVQRHWIQDAVPEKNKGLLHEKLHVPQGEKIPAAKLEKAAHSSNSTLQHEAQFAKNMKGLKKS